MAAAIQLPQPSRAPAAKMPPCEVVGTPWVPIREKPSSDTRLIGALRPGDVVIILEAYSGWGRLEWTDKEGRLLSGWSLMWNEDGEDMIRPLAARTAGDTAGGSSLVCASKVEESLHRDGVIASGDSADGLGYGDGRAYWDKRYAENGTPYDWLGARLHEISRVLDEACRGDRQCRLLHVGCGTSTLPEELHKAGFSNTVNVDISPLAIRRKRNRAMARFPEVRFQVADCTDLRAAGFGDSAFDVVLDKTLLDTFACSQDRAIVIGDYLAEVYRVLAPGGVLLVVTLAAPEGRVPLIEEAPHCDFSVEVEELSFSSGKRGWALTARKGSGRKPPRPWPLVREALQRGGPMWGSVESCPVGI